MSETVLEQLQCELDAAQAAAKQYSDDIVARAQAKFSNAGGCNICRGRGWIVIWDTLDCVRGSYHQHAPCPEAECSPITRAASGLLPSNNKYDRRHRNSVWHRSQITTKVDNETIIKLNKIVEEFICKVGAEEERWTVGSGKLVRVVKASGGRKKFRVDVGIEGLVLKTFINKSGTFKAIIKTTKGEQFFPTVNQLDVIDPDPDTATWDELNKNELQKDGIPIFMKVLKITQKAAFVVVLGSQLPVWLPISMVPDLKGAKLGKTVSALVPAWLAENKGFNVAGPSSS